MGRGAGGGGGETFKANGQNYKNKATNNKARGSALTPILRHQARAPSSGPCRGTGCTTAPLPLDYSSLMHAGVEQWGVVLLIHANYHERAQEGRVHVGVGHAPRAGDHLLHVCLVQQVTRGLLYNFGSTEVVHQLLEYVKTGHSIRSMGNAPWALTTRGVV